MQQVRGKAWRYPLAVLITVLAVGLRYLLIPAIGFTSPYLTQYLAVMFVSVLLGIGPGLVSALIGTALVELCFVEPLGRITFDLHLACRACVTLGSALFLGYIGERLRRAEAAARSDEGAARAALELASRSERRFRSLFDNNPIGVFEVDAQGRFTAANPACEKISGYTRDELLALGFQQLCAPEQLETVTGWFMEALSGLAGMHEIAIMHKDGRRVELRVTGVPINAEPGEKGLFCMAEDVTIQTHVEKALTRKRELLAAIIDNIPVLLCIWDPDLKTFRFNRHMREVLGWTEADAADCDFMSKAYPDLEYRRQVVEYMQSLEGGWRDLKTTARDGSVVDISWANVRLPDGVSIGIGIDIRQRKAVEEILRQDEDALRQAVARYEQQVRLFEGVASTTPDFVYVLDLEGRFLYANRRLLEVWGMDLPGIVGKTCLELGYEHWHHDMHMREIAQVIRMKRPIKGEVPFKAPLTGIFGVYEYIFTPVIGPDGEVELIAGTTRDVTERKKAEEALRRSEKLYRTIGESLAYGIWVCNPQGGIEYVSQSFLDLCEQTMEEQRGFGWTHRLPPEEVEPMLAEWKRCRESGMDWDQEHHILGPDGQYHTVLSRGKAVRDEKGEIVCWAGINLDLTERKKMERQLAEQAELLRRQAADLAEADQRKDEFLAMLAHELRNPLAPVRNAIQILRAAGSNPALAHRQHDMIDRQVTHMARLLDDLLDVSRITRGKITLNRQPIVLADVLIHVVETLAPLIRSRRHTLNFEPPDDGLRVDGDLDRLTQVVGNVMINAVKYTDEGGQIWLNAGSEDGHAVIRVRDTGVGIAPEMLPRVFDLFIQADRSLDRSQGGLGIGLTMVQKLVAMHGGSVGARSEGLGHGSEFIIRLPVLPDGREQETVSNSIEVMQPMHEEKDTRVRVLVVDDVVDSAASMVELLLLWGHEACAAHDGPAALGRAAEFRPEVVLLDIGLPGMDGYEVARRLRAAHGQGFIMIAMTGYGQDTDREQCLTAGFDEHMVKPVNLSRLREFLSRRDRV